MQLLRTNEGKNRKLCAEFIPRTSIDILDETLLKNSGELTIRTVLEAMEIYGKAYYDNQNWAMLSSLSN